MEPSRTSYAEHNNRTTFPRGPCATVFANMAPSEECVALFNNLREWDNEAVAAQLERNPELWSATRPKDMTVSYRQDMVWMLGEVAPTPLSVAVRMARKEDKKLGADMVESMLEVLSVSYPKTPKGNLFLLVSNLIAFSLSFLLLATARNNRTATGNDPFIRQSRLLFTKPCFTDSGTLQSSL